MIQGGTPLYGQVRVAGAKNAILPIIAATLLTEGQTILDGVPPLGDVFTMCRLVAVLGCAAALVGDRLRIDAGVGGEGDPPDELCRLMRASFLIAGPLLAQRGRARLPLPGGCAIGARPIDLHLKGFSALGARVLCEHGCIEVAAAGRLRGARVYLDFPSVTATENIMMASCLAEGVTAIENAAVEPEVVDLADFLNAAGGRVRGAGTDLVVVEGVSSLSGARHRVIPDRIEAGTFMIAAAMTGGDVTLENVVIEHLKPVIAKLRETGVAVEEGGPGALRVFARGRPRATDVKTLPHPGFPTDLQAPMAALLAIAEGTSIVTETVFENRFLHVDELNRMGADIRIEGRTAIIKGVERVTGAPVRATDLRAGAALILAGLAGRGTTEVAGAHHVQRGYAGLDHRLTALGAAIARRPAEGHGAGIAGLPPS